MKLNPLEFEELDRIRIRLPAGFPSLVSANFPGRKISRIFSGQPHSSGSGTCFAWKYL